MKMRTDRLILGLGLLLIASSPALAVQAVYDHFDDSILDPAWEISFQEDASAATGWTYSESGTSLTVTDIVDTHTRTLEEPSQWARVSLSQSFTPLEDFAAHISFGWDSGPQDEIRAMQGVALELVDEFGDPLVRVAYEDAWASYTGALIAEITGSGSVSTGHGAAPFDGATWFDVSRTGDEITILEAGQPFYDGVTDVPVAGVRVEFSYWSTSTVAPPSHFGTEWVDLVSVSGTPVPEPAALSLLLGGGAVLLGRRKKPCLRA